MVLRGFIPSVPSVTASTGPKSQVRLRERDGLAVALKDSRKISTPSADDAFHKTPFPTKGSPTSVERSENTPDSEDLAPLDIVESPSSTPAGEFPGAPESEDHALMPRHAITTSPRPVQVQETEDPWVLTCDRGSTQCELHVGSEPDVTMRVKVSHLASPVTQSSSATSAPVVTVQDEADDLRSFQEDGSDADTPGALQLPKLRPIQARSPFSNDQSRTRIAPNNDQSSMRSAPSTGTQPGPPLLGSSAQSVSIQLPPPGDAVPLSEDAVQLSEDLRNSSLQHLPAAKQAPPTTQASPPSMNIWNPFPRRAAPPEPQVTRTPPMSPDNGAPGSQAETLASAQQPPAASNPPSSGASRGSGSEERMAPGLARPRRSWLPFTQKQAQESSGRAGHPEQHEQEQALQQEQASQQGAQKWQQGVQKWQQGLHQLDGRQVGVEQSQELSLCITVPRFVEVVIEVPRGSFVKRRGDGSVDYVGFLPCPFNYGSVPAFDALDGDPQDALVLGPTMRQGHAQQGRVEALLKFIDAGMVDHKLVCSQNAPSPLRTSSSSSTSPPRTPSTRSFPGSPSMGSPFSPSRNGPPRNPRRSPRAPVSPSRVREGGATQALQGFGEDRGGGPLQGFGMLLSSQWWAGDAGPNPFVPARERGAPACASQCPGRHGSGIALPVARVRASVKCAVCGGKMPFPGPHQEQQPRAQQPHETGFIAPPDSTARVFPRAFLGGASGPEVELVQLNVSLPQFIMLTGFFRFYATCKTVLNRLRGHRGVTRFGGWEVPHGLSSFGDLLPAS